MISTFWKLYAKYFVVSPNQFYLMKVKFVNSNSWKHKIATQRFSLKCKKDKCQYDARDSQLVKFLIGSNFGNIALHSWFSFKRPSRLSWDRWIGHFGRHFFNFVDELWHSKAHHSHNITKVFPWEVSKSCGQLRLLNVDCSVTINSESYETQRRSSESCS